MRIELLGASFDIRTDEDPAYLARVVDLYKSKVAEIQQSVSTTDSLKVAILAGILAADAYLKKGTSDDESTEASGIATRLIRELDVVLDEVTEDRRGPEF